MGADQLQFETYFDCLEAAFAIRLRKQAQGLLDGVHLPIQALPAPA